MICYRDRYPDLQTTYANNGEALRDHYFNHVIGEGRNASCDWAGGYVVRTSISTKHKAHPTSIFLPRKIRAPASPSRPSSFVPKFLLYDDD